MKTICLMALLFGNLALASLVNYDIESDDPRDIPTFLELESAKQELKEKFSGADFDSEEFSVVPMYSVNKYSHLDPKKIVPRDLLRRAVAVFDREGHRFSNQNYMTIVDFSRRSNRQRVFVINLQSGEVWPLRTAHGSGGDKDHDGYVEEVSNISGSHMSSIGFYKVSEIYYGRFGRSIRLDGLSETNSRARERAIVLHGGDYVKEANIIQGRSWGCFVFDWDVKDQVVDKIANGSMLFAEFSVA